MDTTTETTMFPADWNEWRSMWNEWKSAHALKSSRKRIAGKNFLADEVLGTFEINGQAFELSEVTFPGFGAEDRGKTFRYVGISWWDEGNKNVNGGLVTTFADLDELIVAGKPYDA
jgi:hypothetical protein